MSLLAAAALLNCGNAPLHAQALRVQSSPLLAPSAAPGVVSPEVYTDGHVIFRLYAPKASEVRLMADGMEATPGLTDEQFNSTLAGFPMTKGADGVWSIQFGPIQPGVFKYVFSVDGVNALDPKNDAHGGSGSQLANLYEVPGTGYSEYKLDVPHGAIASVLYPSPITHSLRRMHVYTPPGYEAGSKRYPVLYILAGGSGDEAWPTQGKAGATLDNLIAEGKAEPMIVVMPNIYAMGGLASQTSSNTHRDLSNPDIVDTIVPYIDAHYRTKPDRNDRAIAGLSFGGLQTLHMALTRSDLFGSAGVFSSGWYSQLHDEQVSTLATYRTAGKPFKVFWMGAGKKDIAFAANNGTIEVLRKENIQVIPYISEGFHAWNNWRQYLDLFAPLLFKPSTTQK